MLHVPTKLKCITIWTFDLEGSGSMAFFFSVTNSLYFNYISLAMKVKILSQELEVERKRLPPLEDRIVSLESNLASQEDAVR